MRLTVHGSFRKGTRELAVVLQGREMPDFTQMRVLRSCDAPGLVRLVEERETRAGRMTLGYDITGLSSLRGRLKGGRARGVSLGAMLNGMANAMDWCARNVRGATLLLFDPQYVYANQRGDPLFVLLPIKGYARQDEQSPFLLLDALAEIRHVGKADPNERELARRLSEFVGGEGGRSRSIGSSRLLERSAPWRATSGRLVCHGTITGLCASSKTSERERRTGSLVYIRTRWEGDKHVTFDLRVVPRLAGGM